MSFPLKWKDPSSIFPLLLLHTSAIVEVINAGIKQYHNNLLFCFTKSTCLLFHFPPSNWTRQSTTIVTLSSTPSKVQKVPPSFLILCLASNSLYVFRLTPWKRSDCTLAFISLNCQLGYNQFSHWFGLRDYPKNWNEFHILIILICWKYADMNWLLLCRVNWNRQASAVMRYCIETGIEDLHWLVLCPDPT